MKHSRFLQAASFTFFSLLVGAFPFLASAQWNVGRMQATQSGLPSDSIINIIGRLMNWLLALLGFIGVIAFVISGILYLTAAGDEDQIERAKKAMWYSILGVIVALMGLVIIFAVDNLLDFGFFF